MINKFFILFFLPIIFLLSDPIFAAENIPIVTAQLTFAPNVPPPITRSKPVILRADLTSTVVTNPINSQYKYIFWGFNDHTPGPFIRAREGDILEIHLTNKDTSSGMAHNIDFHSATGPGGGGPLLTVPKGVTKVARLKLLHPGLYIYHCAVAPIPMHVANGMYGLILVEPAGGLPKVDKEFYVMQSEFYAAAEPKSDSDIIPFSYLDGLNEHPRFVVFNGRVGSMTDTNALQAKTSDRIRIYFGNAGPNLISSFHVIGAILDKVYREGDLISPPASSIQTTLVPAGGSTVVEIETPVPGNYAFVDHSIFRLDKGAVGFINVTGDKRPDIYFSEEKPSLCEECKVHP